MKVSDFKPGDCVRYVPAHAEKDSNHIDCQNGVVSSVGTVNVFVKYHRQGQLQHTAEATNPCDLIKLEGEYSWLKEST